MLDSLTKLKNKMPKSHPKYSYISQLIEERNISWLKEEIKLIKQVISRYEEQLRNLFKWDHEEDFLLKESSRIEKLINRELKILSYAKEKLMKLFKKEI